MTEEQKQILTFLIVKYGSLETVLDMWLVSDPRISDEEGEVLAAWGDDDTMLYKPDFDIRPMEDENGRYMSVEIDLDATKLD